MTAETDRIDSGRMRAQVEKWSAVNSGTTNLVGLATVASLISDAFSVLPGDLKLLDPDPVEHVLPDGRVTSVAHGSHLLLKVRPDAERRVLLTGHMDTVFDAEHAFQGLVENVPGVINGPGVADMKGGIAIMLAALEAFEANEVSGALGYDVLINSDEETGSASSRTLIEASAKGKLAALTYEPAVTPEGLLAGARPGSGNFSFVVTGLSAHAGRNPEDGRNAIVAAAALALRLADTKDAGLSVNPARIDGGGPNNAVPDHAILRVNLRPRTADDQARATQSIEAAVSAVAMEHEVTIATHGGFGRPPKPLDAKTEQLFALVRDCGRTLGQDIGWRASGGVCDGNNIAACGVPVVDTMGARGGAIHTDQEYLIVDSLAERAVLSALVLQRIAAGAF